VLFVGNTTYCAIGLTKEFGLWKDTVSDPLVLLSVRIGSSVQVKFIEDGCTDPLLNSVQINNR